MKKAFFILGLILLSLLSFSQDTLSYSGEFRSVKGVMDELSCYCNNGGYLTYGRDDEILELCFNSDEDIPNGQLRVEGHFEDIIHEASAMDPCPVGTKTIFIVDAYEVGDVDVSNSQFENEWSGNWTTNYGNLKMEVNDDKLTGTYLNGIISGTIVVNDYGSEVSGEWIQDNGSGWFVFLKDDNDEVFTGQWGYGNDDSPAEGTWDGDKIIEECNLEKEWKGTWITDFGDLKIEINGDELTGTYPDGTISGTCEETGDGSEIFGEFVFKGEKRWFMFKKNNNEDKFYGEWGISDSEVVAGDWNGYLIRPPRGY